MSLHQGTVKLTPQQANVIPAGKYIYTDETFLVSQPIASVEAFPRQGKELVPAYFSFQHGGQEFTPVYTPLPSMSYNYGSYIYNSVTGYQ
tara:strand:+ start:585 stop:854 length:270 start_codon:yes stop_codon:yes gene_type:complete